MTLIITTTEPVHMCAPAYAFVLLYSLHGSLFSATDPKGNALAISCFHLKRTRQYHGNTGSSKPAAGKLYSALAPALFMYFFI